MRPTTLAVVLTAVALAGPGFSQRERSPSSRETLDVPSVLLTRKISNATPGFTDALEREDAFGSSLAALGDLDGDGIVDLAAGSPGDDDGGGPDGGRGAVYVLFRAADGSVRAKQKISAWAGGFHGVLAPVDAFGSSLAGMGDLDGDGVEDLAVGAPFDKSGTIVPQGAVWLLFLRSNGTVKSQVKLDRNTPGLSAITSISPTGFGAALAAKDWNGDGIPDLAVREFSQANRLWLLLLRRDGSIASSRTSALPLTNFPNTSLTFLGDLDGDGLSELAGSSQGEIDTFFLDASGSLRGVSKVLGTFASEFAVAGCDTDGDGADDLILGPTFSRGPIDVLHLRADGSLESRQSFVTFPAVDPLLNDQVGTAVAFLGDDDRDGAPAAAVGARGDPFGQKYGALYTCELDPSGTVTSVVKQGDADGVMAGTLDPQDFFGQALAAVGDLDRDGVVDLAVGVPRDVSDLQVRGAVWILFMRANGAVKSRRKITFGHAGFTGIADSIVLFGSSLAALGDLDGDGTGELAVGAPADDGGRGAVWVLFLAPDGSVKTFTKISAGRGGLHGTLLAGDHFGTGLAAAGDLDGNGTCDLAVGAPGDDDGGVDRGAAWILHLRRDGSVRFEQKLSALQGGFTGAQAKSEFGDALAALGDVDGDGVSDLAVGAPFDDDGRPDKGAVWVLFLTRAGTVRAQQKISGLSGGFTGPLHESDFFGRSLGAPGDLDGDGVRDLLVGTPGDDDGGVLGTNRGGVWVLSLGRDGRVQRQAKISATQGGFTGTLDGRDNFGFGLAVLGDQSGDGVPEIAVGAIGDDDYRQDHGAVWTLALDGVATLDFERGAHALTAFDGESLGPDARLVRGLTLEGLGANLGAALFDSSPGGPNDPSQDPDLLVGRGNVLMLQDSLAGTQTFPGFFDRPNDDADGGVLRFAFRRPVAPRSVDLIDVDAGPGVTVRLVDRLGGTRVYDVPSGWTGDRVAERTAGVATLDLATLAAQPGFHSTATAAERAGFLADQVVTLEIELGGSGAIDDLRYDPRP